MAEKNRWEYRVETFGSTFSQPKDEDLQATLAEWGEEGWELVSVHGLESTNKVRLIAKRPFSSASRRRSSWSEG
jgi:hypothetical protein